MHVVRRWCRFLPKSKPSGFWDKLENVNLFIKELEQKHNLVTPQDWDSIRQKEIKELGGRTLLGKYTLFQIKCLGCPEGKSYFKPEHKPGGYWDEEENILTFLHDLKEKLNLRTPEDWNLINRKQIKLHGGTVLLRKYSLYEIKCKGCPEGKSLFRAPYKPPGYWENKENVTLFLNMIKKKYNLKTPEDWNSITWYHLRSNGGSSLFNKFSIYELKCKACPEGELLFQSAKKPAGYWENEENISAILTKLKEKYNLKTPEDWDSISWDQVRSVGGKSLIHKISIFELKCKGCPEGKQYFQERKSSKFWNDEENVHKFLCELKEKFNLQTDEDWNRLSKNQIKDHGGLGLTLKYSLKEIIQKQDPNRNFTNISQRRSSQRWLFLQVQKLFPGEEIVEDYFHSEISRKTGSSVQFDVYLIKRKIAIEYHGVQHYFDNPDNFAPIELYQNRDKEKAQLCKKFGIQLIVIPYWWDNRLESLKVTLDNSLNKTAIVN